MRAALSRLGDPPSRLRWRRHGPAPAQRAGARSAEAAGGFAPTAIRFLTVVALILSGSVMLAQQPPRPTGGNGLLYIGGYPNLIWIIDEATEKTIGTIQVKSGIPRRMGLSRDLKRFYIIDATAEVVEIIDIASKTTIDTFKLTEGNKRVRISSLEPDPRIATRSC